MADQVLTPTAPATVAPPTNGDQPDQFFAPQMEELLNKAYAEARPHEFKSTATVREPAKPAESEPESADLSSPQTSDAPKKPTVAPESKPPVKAAQWKEVNEERARLKEENAKFKAEQEKYAKEQEKWKSWETERNEFETIKSHNAELLARLEAAALERSPRFENHFRAKTEAAITLAKQAVGDAHAERVAKLLQLPDSEWRTQALDEIRSELPGIRAGRLDKAVDRMDEINLEKSNALAKSKENWQATIEAEKADAQRQKQQFERTFQDRLQKWSDPEKGLALFQKKDGDEAHNAEVEKRIEHARNSLNMTLSADEFSKAALWASAAPGLLQDLLASREREKQKDAELEALKAGGPELQGGGGEETAVDDEKQYEGMSMGEIIAAKVNKAGGFNR